MMKPFTKTFKPEHKKFTLKRKDKGLTLIELGVGLVIVGAVIAGALALFTSTQTGQRVSQVQSDMQAVRSAVQSRMFQTSDMDEAVDHEALVNAGLLPTTIRTSGDATDPVFNHVMGGQMELTALNTHFVISINRIPRAACERLTTSIGPWYSIYRAAASTTAIEEDRPDAAAIETNPLGFINANECQAGDNTIHFVSN